MTKTISEWFMEVQDDELRCKLMYNLEKHPHPIYRSNSAAGNLGNAIVKGFIWKNTEEGYDYWLSVYQEAHAHAAADANLLAKVEPINFIVSASDGKAIKHWFASVKDKRMRDRLFRNLRNSPGYYGDSDAIVESLGAAINTGFFWQHTPEGGDYWYAVAEGFTDALLNEKVLHDSFFSCLAPTQLTIASPKAKSVRDWYIAMVKEPKFDGPIARAYSDHLRKTFMAPALGMPYYAPVNVKALTIAEWFSCVVDRDLRAAMLYNLANYELYGIDFGSAAIADSLAAAIAHGFNWGDAPEREQYWDKLFKAASTIKLFPEPVHTKTGLIEILNHARDLKKERLLRDPYAAAAKEALRKYRTDLGSPASPRWAEVFEKLPARTPSPVLTRLEAERKYAEWGFSIACCGHWDKILEACRSLPPAKPFIEYCFGENRKGKVTTAKGKTVCQEADELINGDRATDYGDAKENMTDIAKGWSVITKADVTPEKVALMMSWLKICRESNGKSKRDNIVDGIGYLALAEKVKRG